MHPVIDGRLDMNGLVRRGVLGGLIIVSLAATWAGAAVPVIPEGQCVYLVGAPPGAPAAAEEQKVSGQGTFYHWGVTACGTAVERDGENMVQAWTSGLSYPYDCRRFAWIAHEFRISSAGEMVPADVTMEGDFNGRAEVLHYGWTGLGNPGPIQLRADLIEMDPRTGREILVVGEEISNQRSPAWGDPDQDPLVWRERFGRRLAARLRPGATYRIRLHLEIWDGTDHGSAQVDVGRPGSPGHFARYNRIKVCVDAPSEVESLLEILEAKADALEGKMDAMQSDIIDLGSQVAENGQKLDLLEAKMDQVLALLGDMDAKQCESIRLHLTPEGLRASDCCEAETWFPDGRWVPSCGGTILSVPSPPPPLLPMDPPRSP